MAERITIKRTITGQVVPDTVIECGKATVNMKREIGGGVAAIDFAGCAPDEDGWKMIYAVYTNIVQVIREVKADG